MKKKIVLLLAPEQLHLFHTNPTILRNIPHVHFLIGGIMLVLYIIKLSEWLVFQRNIYICISVHAILNKYMHALHSLLHPFSQLQIIS